MILYIIQRKKIMKSLLILHSLNSSLCSEWQILCKCVIQREFIPLSGVNDRRIQKAYCLILDPSHSFRMTTWCTEDSSLCSEWQILCKCVIQREFIPLSGVNDRRIQKAYCLILDPSHSFRMTTWCTEDSSLCSEWQILCKCVIQREFIPLSGVNDRRIQKAYCLILDLYPASLYQ